MDASESATPPKRLCLRWPPPQREHLPLDLLLEVVARSDDVGTIIRCAAASKTLRRAMLGTGFRPRSRVGLLAAVHAGYDPASLLGVSYASSSSDDDDIVRASWRLRFDTGLLRSFELVSSRGGLLVLWRHEAESQPELRVCNTFTGDMACLPYMDEEDGKWGNAGIYRPALLIVDDDDAGRSFELLVMDGCLRTCVFSSKDGKWGAIRRVKAPPEHSSWCFVNQSMNTSPAIVGRTVYWICCRARRGIAARVFVLAVDADGTQATAIEPPPQGYHGSMGSCTVATTADGNKLSMFVPEAEVISMWTRSAEEGWSRDVVISKQVWSAMDARRMVCWCVGLKSRSVLFWVERVGLIELDLETMKADVLRGGGEHGATGVAGVCFHEIDMTSLLQGLFVYVWIGLVLYGMGWIEFMSRGLSL